MTAPGTAAHHGAAAYRDRYELVRRREATRSNEQWQADHTKLYVMVLDAAGRRARPWLTVVLDDHSRVVASYTVFLVAPTALQTALALRQAIWHKSDPAWPVCGLPDFAATVAQTSPTRTSPASSRPPAFERYPAAPYGVEAARDH